MPLGGEGSAWERWPLQYGEWLSTRILLAVPSVLFPEPPDSPHVSLVHSALLHLEPKVTGCKWNSVIWLFKWLSAFLAIFSWQTGPCCFSQLDVNLGSFPALVLQTGECSLGFRAHTSQEEHLSCWNIPLELQLLPVGTHTALLHHLHTPYQSHCGEVVSSLCPWL